MRQFTLVFVTFAFLTCAKLSHAAIELCRCLPDSACWPSPAVWQAFSSSLRKPLVEVRPIAAPCHYPTFDASNCATVLSNFEKSLWRADQAGASQYQNYEELRNGAVACLAESPANATCQQGNVPLYVVNASSVRDVQLSVLFAKQHNLKLIVKNSGHGTFRSMGAGALLLWTHFLKDITFEDQFIPEGPHSSAIWQPAVTIGSGVQWGELYASVAAHNRTIVGGFGAGGSVGAGGGWVLGGGHSALSPSYGLGVDNVLQFTVVISNGSFVTANSFLNTDLFWALRGGGGPSFGIVITVTYRTHPNLPIVAAFFEASTNSSSAQLSLLSTFHRVQISLADAGWAGFYPFTTQSLAFTYIMNNASLELADGVMQSFFKTAVSLPGVNVTLATTVAYTEFYTWYAENFEDESIHGTGYNYTLADVVGINGFSSSRLLPRSLFESSPDSIGEALLQMPGGRGFLVGGGAVAQVHPDSTAVTPAWRTALVDISLGTVYVDGTPAEEVEALKVKTSDWAGLLRNITPGSGTYLNEPDLLEPNWQEAYWGSHYPRLRSIKATYDPMDLFIVHLGVGSEDWDDIVSCKLV